MLNFDKFMKPITKEKKSEKARKQDASRAKERQANDERRRHYLTRFREKWQNRIIFRNR